MRETVPNPREVAVGGRRFLEKSLLSGINWSSDTNSRAMVLVQSILERIHRSHSTPLRGMMSCHMSLPISTLKSGGWYKKYKSGRW